MTRSSPCNPLKALPSSGTDAIARAPRPWLSRRRHECAFPVAGEGATTLSCCNPCGRWTYCEAHRGVMRGALAYPDRFERAILAWLARRAEQAALDPVGESDEPPSSDSPAVLRVAA